MFRMRPGIPAEQHRSDQAHVAGQTDQVDMLALQQGADGFLVGGLVRESGGIDMPGGDAESGGFFQANGVGTVADGQAHREIGARGSRGADDGREIAPASGKKDRYIPLFHDRCSLLDVFMPRMAAPGGVG